MGNTFYFSAYTDENGAEMWSYDGTNAEMVEDINVGSNSSNAYEFTPFNNKIIFRADNGTLGKELWQFIPSTLSVSELKNNNYTLFPNPVSDFINLKSSYIISNVEIYNTLGEIIKNQDIESDSVKMNVESLNPGIYIIKLKSDIGIESLKFIKE